MIVVFELRSKLTVIFLMNDLNPLLKNTLINKKNWSAVPNDVREAALN